MTTPPPPGWYQDPQGAPGVQRYWNGAAWTEHTHTGPVGVPAAAQPYSPSYRTTGPVLASYGRRLGGWIIDWLILGVVSTIILLPFGGLFHTTNVYGVNGLSTSHSVSFHLSGWGFFVSALLILGYGTVLCGSQRGQTVGMMAVGVRAVRDGTHDRLGYPRAAIRALAESVLRSFELLSPFLILIWFLDFLYPLWDKKRQTLHDKVGRSVVLRGEPPTG